MIEEEYIQYSRDNLNKLLERINKFKKTRSKTEVNLAIKCLPFFHCVRQCNIIEVLKSGEVRTKNEIDFAEMSNSMTDYIQGFDRHSSWSIGNPWTEYGNYCFVYGLEHFDNDLMIFSGDPWLWGHKKLQENFLTKKDFTILARNMAARNLLWFGGGVFFKVPWKINLLKSFEWNFRRFEVKYNKSLSIQDADEFFIWGEFDGFLFNIVRMFWKPFWLFLAVVYIIVVTLL